MKIGLFVTLEHEAHEDSTEHLRNLKEQVRAANAIGTATPSALPNSASAWAGQAWRKRRC